MRFPSLHRSHTLELPGIAVLLFLPAVLVGLHRACTDIAKVIARLRWTRLFRRSSRRAALKLVEVAPDRFRLHVRSYGGGSLVLRRPLQ